MCSYLKMHIPYFHALKKTKQNKILIREITLRRTISCHVTMGWHDASRIRPILRVSFSLKVERIPSQCQGSSRWLPEGPRQDSKGSPSQARPPEALFRSPVTSSRRLCPGALGAVAAFWDHANLFSSRHCYRLWLSEVSRPWVLPQAGH